MTGTGAVVTTLASFVGRRKQLEDARQAMSRSRLVTLTGPGGVGKTRIARESADRMRRGFADGVWMVGLADMDVGANEESIAAKILLALTVNDRSARGPENNLLNFVRDRRLLIVLDNCEHLLHAVAVLTVKMLEAAPGLRILATSREALGIVGEQVCLTPPLTTPEAGRSYPPRELEVFEAVQLLAERARAADPRFAITETNAAAVAQLCNQLDGMPLAIELAATRVRSLSVTQIVERLDDMFSLLRVGDRAAMQRQQSLRTLIDWSYDLCTPAERLLWTRLSVFPGSFDLRAAEEVCSFGDLAREQVYEGLDRLVAQSILLTDRSGEQLRYHLLATVREYASQMLAASGEHADVRGRLRDHLIARTSTIVEDWCGPGQEAALAELAADHATFVSVLRACAIEGEQDLGLELASKLRYHWLPGGFLAEGRHWLDLFLRHTSGATVARGDALWVVTWIASITGDLAGAASYLRELRELAAELGDRRLEAHVDHWTALQQPFGEGVSAEVSDLRRAVRGHAEAGDTAMELTASFMLAFALAYDERVEESVEASCRAIEVSARHGESFARSYALWIKGLAHWKLHDFEAAEDALRQTLEIQRRFRDRFVTACAIATLAWVAVSQRRYERAAELAALSDMLWGSLRTTLGALGPRVEADTTACMAAITSALGAKRVTAVARELAHCSLIDAIDVAVDGARKTSASATPSLAPLTKREAEVAELVAEGLSNRDISERLGISPRTTDGHMERILSKLHFNTRAQVAAWVVGRVNVGPVSKVAEDGSAGPGRENG